jgi:putative ABC transport system permease protein
VSPGFSFRLGLWLLSRLVKRRGNDGLYGDIEELYRLRIENKGRRNADVWIWRQILGTIRHAILDFFYWRYVMFASYFKIMLRNFNRQKLYGLINMAGLAVGLTGCILIILFIRYELSFDRFHENADEIYRVVQRNPGQVYQGTDWYNNTPGPLKAALAADFPEIVRSTRVLSMWKPRIMNRGLLQREDRFFVVDPEFLEMFTFPLAAGDPRTALSEPFALVLTEDAAKRYFGWQDPLGQVLNVDGLHDFKITGIVRNPPASSHFHFDFLASFPSWSAMRPKRFVESWGYSPYKTYIQLPHGRKPADLDAKLPAFARRHQAGGTSSEWHLQAMTGIHLYGRLNGELEANGDIRSIYLTAAIGFFIMIIAGLNYMNLATARSARRAKEIGVRKVVGAERSHLVRQFLGESIAFTLIAGGLSLFLVRLFLPGFSALVARPLTFGLVGQAGSLALIAAAVLITGLAAGSYPALYLSSIRPVGVLKGAFRSDPKKSKGFRRTLVIAQFVISIALIACTMIVRLQLRFMKEKDLGYAQDRIVTFEVRDPAVQRNPLPLRDALNRSSRISGAAFSSELPVQILGKNDAFWEGKSARDDLSIYVLGVDENFLDFYGIKLLHGRMFGRESAADAENAFLLNQAAVNALGWKDPLGKRFGIDPAMKNTVIGVVDDFNFSPLNSKIEPLAIHLLHPTLVGFGDANYGSIKIEANDIPGSLAVIEKTMKSVSPAYPFSYSFLDKRIEAMYAAEYKLGRILGVFTGIALFIACLGLFGLASFIAEQRTKEIGIRRILGASMAGIVTLLNREFLIWIGAAGMLACPVAYAVMQLWIRKFAYRAPITAGIFLGAVISALAVALATVSLQTWRAARRNPSNNLRYE